MPSLLALLAAGAFLCGTYCGAKSLGIIFGAIRKLAGSQLFHRLPPPVQLQAFFATPTANPKFPRFTSKCFLFYSGAIAMFALALPKITLITLGSRTPFFVSAGAMASMGIMLALAASRAHFPVGGLGWCASCGCDMQVIGLGQMGGVFMDRDEMIFGFGVAEQCRECGRLYCASCYPQRGHNRCQCGRGRNKVIREAGAVYHGSMRLIKVRY
jgi:hypothetical protein